MDETTLLLIFLSLVLGCGAWCVFIWAVKKGEFEDVEKPKHRMLDDD
jgi:cbb3-type cytochrome oxidase maturation protein